MRRSAAIKIRSNPNADRRSMATVCVSLLGCRWERNATPTGGGGGPRELRLTFERLEDRTLLSGVTPLALDDLYSTPHDNVLYGGSVLDNDSCPEYNPLTASLASGPSNGHVELQSDGTFVYVPYSGYVGIDNFVYTLSNGSATATATVYIDVFNSVPSTADDYYDVVHDRVLEGSSILLNDSDADGDLLTAVLVSGPSNGSLDLRSDGTFCFTSEAGFVGMVSFVYEATDGITTTQATVYISVTNSSPVFALTDWISVESLLPSSDLIFEDGMVIGQLVAYDADGDPLVFSGASSYFAIDSTTGHIVVVDGEGLTAYFSSGDVENLTVPVSVADGIAVVFSEFVLSSAFGWIDQSEIYVLESNGVEYTPATAAELIGILEGIRDRGNQVSTLIIKGHGYSGGIEVGDGGEVLTAPEGSLSNSVYIGDDVTELLKDVTNAETTISLRGCFTYDLAKRVECRLDGAKVYGAIRFVIGIPGTTWGIGVYPP